LDDSNRLLIEKIKASKRLELALRKSKSFRELEESVDKINDTEPKAENKPVQPATTDLTAKPVSMKATVSDAGSTIDKGIDNTPVKVNN
jgi:hypothetical protein